MTGTNPAARRAPLPRPRLILVLVLAIATVLGGVAASGVLPAAAEGEDATVTTDQAPEQPDVVSTQPPAPTAPPTQPPLPTATPTQAPEPTATPPAPTVAPTIAPTATPPEPTPTQTPVPTATPPDSAATPSDPAAKPTTADTARGLMLAAVQPIPAPTCTSAPIAGEGKEYTRFTCSALVGEPTQTYTLHISAPTAGWQYRPVIPGGPASTWSEAAQTYTFSHQIGDFQLDLWQATPAAPATGAVTLSVTVPDDAEVLRFDLTALDDAEAVPFALTATGDPPAQTPFQCAGPQPTDDPQVVVYACAYAVDFGSPASVSITFHATVTAGWDVGLDGTITGPKGDITLTPSPLNGDGEAATTYKRDNQSANTEAGTIYVRLRAPAGSDPTTVTLWQTCTEPLTGDCAEIPIATLQATTHPACADLADAGVTASLTGGSLAPLPFSLAPRPNPNTGTATLTVRNPKRCSGWGVSISGTDLAYSGPAPGGTAIPAGNLSVTAPGMTSLTLSGEAQPLVTGGGTDEEYTYSLALALDIPRGKLAGTYTSTLTISTTAAPAGS